MAIPVRLPAYECPGALALTFPHSSQSNYLRSLDLSNATVNVHYDYDSVTYNRDIFASAPSNKVIVIHFTASSAGKISLQVQFYQPADGDLQHRRKRSDDGCHGYGHRGRTLLFDAA